jgi:SAM-dependent methyltransferase
MASCYGKYASVYDFIYSEKPYKSESQFIDDCFQKYGKFPIKNILELACGTGAHALELEKRGYNIIATDKSEEMIGYAQEKGNSIKSEIDFRVLDMRSLNFHKNSFDAIYSLFDSIGYVTSNDDLNRTFRGISDGLKNSGLFIFEFWHAGAMLKYFEPVRTKYLKSENGNILRISETKLDYKNQTAFVKYSIYELLNDGTFTSYNETHQTRFFLIQEMANFLTSNDLVPLKFFDGFSFSEKISEDTWHIICLAQKAKS